MDVVVVLIQYDKVIIQPIAPEYASHLGDPELSRSEQKGMKESRFEKILKICH